MNGFSPGGVPADIVAALEARSARLAGFASRLVYFETAGSTNDEADRLAADGAAARDGRRGRRAERRPRADGAAVVLTGGRRALRVGGSCGRTVSGTLVIVGIAKTSPTVPSLSRRPPRSR